MASPRSGAAVIPAPSMGWNAKDPISQMDPLYALDPVNFIANGGAVDLRKGSIQWATVGAGTLFQRVLCMAEYIQSSGTAYMIAILSDGVNRYPYSLSTGGGATDISGGVSIGSNATITPMFFCNFNNRIFIKSNDSTKDVYHWTGTGNVALSGFVGPGGDDKALRQMCVYKSRIYFCGVDAKIWYVPGAAGIGAVTGTMTSFDFATLFPHGGTIFYANTISPNPANNREQYMVVVSSSGDVLLFGGDSPDSATWTILGSYYSGAPLGKQSFIPFQNDILMITRQGLVSIIALLSGTALENAYLSDYVGAPLRQYIQAAIAIDDLDSITGVYYPTGNYILLNLRTSAASDEFSQFIFYTINKSWWLFSGYSTPRFWLPFNSGLYFAVSYYGGIFQADTGSSDIDALTGDVISKTIKLRHAFNYLGNNIANKVFTQAIPTIYQSEGLDLTLDCDVDYTDVVATSREQDLTDTAYKLYQPRMGLINQVNGSAVSIRIDGQVTTKRMSLQATKVYWIEGGID